MATSMPSWRAGTFGHATTDIRTTRLIELVDLAPLHWRSGARSAAAELAKRMKIQPSYLYRILPHVEKDGKVTKRDKG
jgi:hypothetical protein